MVLPVIMKLIHDLYQKTLKSDKGAIPLNTPEWYSAFDGMGVAGSGSYDFIYVRNKARELFPSYQFHLFESDVGGEYKYFLQYEKI